MTHPDDTDPTPAQAQTARTSPPLTSGHPNSLHPNSLHPTSGHPTSGHPTSGQLPSRSAGDRPETAEEWEQVRRSVAMLPPGAWAMRREQSLHALAELLTTLRKAQKR